MLRQSDRLGDLERKQEDLNARLQDLPTDVPDPHPASADPYRRKINQLTEALGNPDSAAEAATTLRELSTGS